MGIKGKEHNFILAYVLLHHHVQTETLRGSRQYGSIVPITELPCSALGARVDLEAMKGEAGFLMPTDTFTDKVTFTVSNFIILLPTLTHSLVWDGIDLRYPILTLLVSLL